MSGIGLPNYEDTKVMGLLAIRQEIWREPNAKRTTNQEIADRL
jgi:hypothetical protein